MKINETVTFFGLLFFEDDTSENDTVNLSNKYIADRFNILILNAANLAKSLRLQNLNFKLLTNQKDRIKKKLEGSMFEVEEINFLEQVPKNIRFYASHHKFDVFRHLANLGAGYFIFCDIDMMCINDMPHGLSFNIHHKNPIAYDISDQVIPAYGNERIISDMKRLSGAVTEGRWYGGELIGGPSEFFRSLYNKVQLLLPKYIKHSSSFHHIGDEMLVSTALNLLKNERVMVSDAGTLGIVNRFWPIKVSHYQRSFDYNHNVFLLHLPSDKVFLSKSAQNDFDNSKDYLTLYKNYLNSLNFKLRKKYQETKKKLKKLKII